MERSNIIGGSNIYPCMDDPLEDQEFVNHIEDYGHLKSIKNRQEFSASTVRLTEKQKQLLKIEIRCALLKRPDPCWGYINGAGIKSKCIEGKCPHIMECNPDYTEEQAIYWTMSDEARSMYGDPRKLKKYYLVDIVSDQEMLKYSSDVEIAIEGYDPTEKSVSKIPAKSSSKERKKIIIGYEETYFGDADNQLSPIWGYVDDEENAGSFVTTKYGSTSRSIRKNTYEPRETEKKQSRPKTKQINEKPVTASVQETDQVFVNKKEFDEKKQKEYRDILKRKISDTYPLTNLSNELLSDISDDISIILSNEAELAYVSGMLFQTRLKHDIEMVSEGIRIHLWKADSDNIPTSAVYMISSGFVNQGCDLQNENIWKRVCEADKVVGLSVSGREFFSFDTQRGIRWACRNLYGATHIVVRSEDIVLTEKVTGEQNIILTKEKDRYSVVSTLNADELGETSKSFWEVLEKLKKSGEISELPRVISGLVVFKNASGVIIKGIGHMKFDEY